MSAEDRFSTVEDFDPSTEHVMAMAPEKKQIGETNTFYHDMILHYNHGTESSPAVGPILFELPPVVARYGISAVPADPSKFTMSFELPETDEIKAKVIHLNDRLYESIVEIFTPHAKRVGFPKFSPDNAEMVFKKPIYYPVDKKTQEPIKGRAPLFTAKLIKGRSVFRDADLNPISWEDLKGRRVECIPLVQYEKLYIGGGKICLQTKLRSAIVTNVISRDGQFLQSVTAERIKAVDPEAGQRVSHQIKTVNEEDGDKKTDTSEPTQNEDASSKEKEFSDLMNTL